MPYHHLSAAPSGDSVWSDRTVALTERTFAPPAQAIEVSDPEPATRVMFLRLRAGWDEPVHPSPMRQKLVVLAGAVRVTASDGTARDLGPGAVWHRSDKTGLGHHTRVIGDTDFEALVVQLE